MIREIRAELKKVKQREGGTLRAHREAACKDKLRLPVAVLAPVIKV